MDEGSPTYDIAVSFSGQQRDYVEKVVRACEALGVRVFYDLNEAGQLWGKNVIAELRRIYGGVSARFVVPFLSRDYLAGGYPLDEFLTAMTSNVERGGGYLLPVLMDDVDVGPELLNPAVIYLRSADYGPAELARIIAGRVATARADQHSSRDVAGLVRDTRPLPVSETSRGPRQLPMAPRWHVARERELGLVAAALDDGPARMAVIEGAGGAGKTTLALHWAHRNTGRFPDGQLFANLRGFDPRAAPAEPVTVLHGFLTALGVDPAAVPGEPDVAAALFRSLVADRRMMILLDNAWDAEQVIPLLPGSPSCAVVVTTRRRLSAMRVRGASVVRLEMMAEADARELLSRLLVDEGVEAEPAAVGGIARRCGGLPLALAIAAARVAAHPEFPMPVFVDELDDETSRLSAFDADDATSLRAVLSWSSAALDEQLREAFGLLGVVPLGEITTIAAAALWAVPAARAAGMLRSLEAANLVNQYEPGRFQVHDLVRLHAAELPGAYDAQAALARLVSLYAHTARAADRLLYPYRHAYDPPDLPDGCEPFPLADEPAAVTWFRVEHAFLVAVHEAAAGLGLHAAVWHIAHGLDTYQFRLGLLAGNIGSSRLGLAAALEIGSPRLVASSLRQLGRACTRADELDEAERCLTRALQVEEEAGFAMGQAHAHHDLQRVHAMRGEHGEALRHATSAIKLYRAEHNPVGEAHALNALGWQHAQLANLDLAREHCELALSLHVAHGNASGQASTSDTLGHIARMTGRLDEAAEHFRAAIRHARQLDNRFGEADHTEHLADVLSARGDRDDAEALLRKAYDLFLAQHRLADADRVRARLDNRSQPR
ncbi:tetratricopeptide repeat protein [Amycolatopsis sp. cmx-8-4]|uniref:tetratricopeptide repeat protein n=1 Tax=Amycolatopsis sp. cmx-8-4 TaxID=2790947 RepID=UPI00397E2E8C